MFSSALSRFAGKQPQQEDLKNNPKHQSEHAPDHTESGSPFTRQFRVQSHDDGHYSVGEGDAYEGDTHYEDLDSAFNHVSSALQSGGDDGDGDENMAADSKGGKSKVYKG